MKEQGLNKSLQALQEESGASIASIDDTDSLVSQIIQGQWEAVLRSLYGIHLDSRLLVPLYEQMFLELAESGQTDVARLILRQSDPLGRFLRSENEQKYIKLENALSTAILSKSAGARIDLSAGGGKEQRRAKIAQELTKHLKTIPKGRLLSLLGDALRFQEQSIIKQDEMETVQFDIFHGIIPIMRTEMDCVASFCYKTVKLSHGHHAEAAAFSPDGQYLAVGLADGFIEIWSTITGQPRSDLPYQSGTRSNFMIMETAILAISFSQDSQLLAVGTLNGDVGIWKVTNGQCIRRLPKAHDGGCSSVSFSSDGNCLLTAGFDGSVRIFNTRTGSIQKQFVGHTEFVLRATFSKEASRVLSVSADGTLRIWATKTGECLETIYPSSEGEHQLAKKTVKTICPLQRHPDAFIVCAQDAPLQIYGANGKRGKIFSPDEPVDFVEAACSSSGKFVYGFAGDKHVYCFNYETGKMEGSFRVTDAEDLILSVHHPHLNLMVTLDTHNLVKFWKAP